MKMLIILFLVPVIVLLLGILRIGCIVEYRKEGAFVWVRVGMLRILVLPSGRKRTKKKTEKKQSVFSGGPVELVMDFLPLLLDAVKLLRRKLRVDKLEIVFTAASKDPADAAVQYGQAHATLGAIWDPLTSAFHVKEGRARVDMDFDAQHPTLYLFSSVSLTLRQALALSVVLLWKVLRVFLTKRNRCKQVTEQRKVV